MRKKQSLTNGVSPTALSLSAIHSIKGIVINNTWEAHCWMGALKYIFTLISLISTCYFIKASNQPLPPSCISLSKLVIVPSRRYKVFQDCLSQMIHYFNNFRRTELPKYFTMEVNTELYHFILSKYSF